MDQLRPTRYDIPYLQLNHFHYGGEITSFKIRKQPFYQTQAITY